MEECEDDALNNRDCEEADLDLKRGCNQMYSCSHACTMRHLGTDEDTCLDNCDRNGQSGCSPNMTLEFDEDQFDCEFSLCGSCKREGCSSKFPKTEECELGCKSYGMYS